MSHASPLGARLAALRRLSAPELRKEWARVYGTPAPRRIGSDLLIRAIAYRIQEKMYGGLKSATVRRLRRLAEQLRTGREVRDETPAKLQPGSQLMREWNSRTERVEVLDKGFAWRGTVYPSLSAVARAITGARWSGPRFFGLLGKPRPDGAGPSDPVSPR